MKAFVLFIMVFQACLIIISTALYIYGVIGLTSVVANICINAVFFVVNLLTLKSMRATK